MLLNVYIFKHFINGIATETFFPPYIVHYKTKHIYLFYTYCVAHNL